MDCELNRSILHGDIFDKIKEIPTNSIDCVITSPPYWGLRNYQVEGQIGIEPDFRNFLQVMQQVMDELRRVLKDSGTCWVNIGDTYNSAKKGNTNELYSTKMRDAQTFEKNADKSIPLKSRLGIPERFYIDCIDNGWLARNHIPWVKTTHMPSSVKDRFTNMWESVFFFSKKREYYFNLDAVREKTTTKPGSQQSRDRRVGYEQVDLTGEKLEEEVKTNKQDTTLGADGKPIQTYKGFNARWKSQQRKYADNSYTYNVAQTINTIHNGGHYNNSTGKNLNHPKGKNPGDVFFIQPIPFLGAHHATFPLKLPLKILKCACPPDGIVLDCFMGAGTTALAAEKLGLRWIGIELNEKSIQLTRKRINAFRNSPLGEYTE